MKRISDNFPDLKDYYLISEDGRVYSEKSKIFLKPMVDKYGYLFIRPMGIDGKPKNRFIHRLVLGVYSNLENKEDYTVNHKDGNKENNSLENLEWMTIEENNSHALEYKLNGKTGETNPNAKLTIKDVEEILELLNSKCGSEIARMYNVSPGTIGNIKHRRTFKKEIEEILKRRETFND